MFFATLCIILTRNHKAEKKIVLTYLRETNHLSIHWVQHYYSCMKELFVTSSYGLELILRFKFSEWTFAFYVLHISLVCQSIFFLLFMEKMTELYL